MIASASTPEGGRDDAGFPVVGIGASAGGLDACRKLLDALPAGHGMALILVQHLDPTHESMLVELLASHTAMQVRQATDGMAVEPDKLYVIPPGAYLTVGGGVVHLSRPQARHGARLPFDHLLQSMADAYGARAVCVILSGTGSDGCAGAKQIRMKGGRVIAQAPEEAAYDGMPRSAITAGVVDQVLAVAKIPAALARLRTHPVPPSEPEGESAPEAQPHAAPAPWLADIIGLLRSRTAHDFTLYKPGTLQRRIERRMALAAIKPADSGRYLQRLQTDKTELDLLARDLLINVTSFFRDPAVFAPRSDIVPQPADLSAAGSTGEGDFDVPFRAARRRGPSARPFGNDQRRRPAVRGDFEAGAAVSACRAQAAG